MKPLSAMLLFCMVAFPALGLAQNARPAMSLTPDQMYEQYQNDPLFLDKYRGTVIEVTGVLLSATTGGQNLVRLKTSASSGVLAHQVLCVVPAADKMSLAPLRPDMPVNITGTLARFTMTFGGALDPCQVDLAGTGAAAQDRQIAEAKKQIADAQKQLAELERQVGAPGDPPAQRSTGSTFTPDQLAEQYQTDPLFSDKYQGKTVHVTGVVFTAGTSGLVVVYTSPASSITAKPVACHVPQGQTAPLASLKKNTPVRLTGVFTSFHPVYGGTLNPCSVEIVR
jgi:hypothetical protein